MLLLLLLLLPPELTGRANSSSKPQSPLSSSRRTSRSPPLMLLLLLQLLLLLLQFLMPSRVPRGVTWSRLQQRWLVQYSLLSAHTAVLLEEVLSGKTRKTGTVLQVASSMYFLHFLTSAFAKNCRGCSVPQF